MRLELLSELLKELIKNSTSLLEEVRLLASNNKIERAMFLTVIAIEEMGKINMYMNSIQYGKDLKEFWKRFNKYKTKHQFKIFRSLTFKKHMDLNFDFEGLEDLSKGIDRIKMSNIYVDIKGDEILTPFGTVNPEDYSNFYNFATELLNHHTTLLENGYYEVDFLRLMKEFYSNEEIQVLLSDLFDEKIGPEDYIERLMSIAITKEDDIFAQILLSGIYTNLAGEEI